MNGCTTPGIFEFRSMLIYQLKQNLTCLNLNEILYLTSKAQQKLITFLDMSVIFSTLIQDLYFKHVKKNECCKNLRSKRIDE